MPSTHCLARSILLGTLELLLVASPLPSQQSGSTFHAQTDLVLVNVTVRDKKGNFIRNLKPGNFTIFEDNKPQKIASFDLETTDVAVTQDVTQAAPLPETSPTTIPASSLSSPENEFKDRRLIILFFDLSAMEPEEIQRAVSSAVRYVDTQMTAADLWQLLL
jgi:VWFA-related protein